MIAVVGAAIIRHATVLAARRRGPGPTTGRWEFPGGKVNPGETAEAAVAREIAEELGCSIVVDGWLQASGTDGVIQLRVAVCTLADGEPIAVEHDELRWLTPEQLDEVDWLGPDRPMLPELRERLLDGELLVGGNVGGAIRIGDTVRRPCGPWTPAVHALLHHLRQRGLPATPGVHGLDARGREVLDFLPGRVIDVDTEELGDSELTSLTAWLRALHDAVADFDHPGPWRFFGVPDPQLIGHNDVAPYNVGVTDGVVSAVFDWDLAGPTTVLMELGHLAWTSVPLFRPLPANRVARRLRLIADAYGDPSITAATVLAAVEPRVQVAIDGIREAGRLGDEGIRNLIRTGEPERTEVSLAAFRQRRPGIRMALDSPVQACRGQAADSSSSSASIAAPANWDR